MEFKKLTLIVTLCLLISFLAFAQPPIPGDDDEVPVDGGISLLVAAGTIWGINKIRKKKNE